MRSEIGPPGAAKRLGLVVVAVLLVTSMGLSGYVPASSGPSSGPADGFVGEAKATHDCDRKDAVVNGVFGFYSAIGESLGGSSVACDMVHSDTTARQVYEAESEQDHIDIYQGGVSIMNSHNSFLAMNKNYRNETARVAWMKAEKRIAECYKAGKRKSVCKSEARTAIKDYYSVKQMNLIAEWDATVTDANYLNHRSKNESNVSDFAFVLRAQTGGNNRSEQSPGDNLETVSITLANGSNAESVKIVADTGADYTGYTQVNGQNDSDGYLYYLVRGPNEKDETYRIWQAPEMHKQWRAYETQNDDLTTDADNFTEAIWSDLENGNLNASDVVSRTTTMFEYGTAVRNGSADYADWLAATATMGTEAPNLNETGTMTVDVNGQKSDGVLFGEPPNGEWKVGKTYDPSNIDGPVQFATKDGQMKQIEDPFTLDRATDRNGNERSTVDTKRYNYQTADTAGTQEKYDELLNATKNIQARSEESASGGGGSSGGGTLPDWLTRTYFGVPLWAFAAVGLLLLVLFGGGS